MVENYSGSNHGFINKKAYPEYRFNSEGRGEIYVSMRASQNHTVVRIRMDSTLVRVDFLDYRKIIAKRGGKRRDVIDFVVSKTSDLKILSDFFIYHKIHNFTPPSPDSWRNFNINSTDNYKTIRLQNGQEVEVTHSHSLLSKNFIKWLQKKGYDNIEDECILANLDRIDVRFRLKEKHIFSELKTVSGSSTKRAIREALGQILDYQYYDDSEKADELWIVINDECSESDVSFINKLINIHHLPLRLVWEKNQGFACFPDLQDLK
ncbi:hypothetical protein [Imhoffiella purpurea]|uniref:hypothetical protein n=1 Tax=Imhoffiella purpurea TaxID=1249627 RepID=UPI0012FDF97F|nr:hypothetical protein [Imhoffiella purpurea]